MPAATPEKRARQRANKLLLKPGSAPLIPARETPTIPSNCLPSSPPPPTTASTTMTPISFTISYTPLAISYPEAPDPAAKLPTDAVRVTRAELAIMLRQSYLHGSEHGWKANFIFAKERLQADFKEDMQKATIDFAEHEKRIRDEEFDRGFEDGRDVGRKAQLSSLKESLQATNETQHLRASEQFSERAQELTDEAFGHGFKDGHDAGTRQEVERRESTRDLRDFGTQTESITTASSPSISTATVDSAPQTFDPISEIPPIPILLSAPTFNWSDDATLLSILPSTASLTPLLPSTTIPRDFSGLCSGNATPFGSIPRRTSRRNRYNTRPSFSSRSLPPRRSWTSSRPTYNRPQHGHHPPPYHLPRSATLNWDQDPRLFELSHVLKALGWTRT